METEDVTLDGRTDTFSMNDSRATERIANVIARLRMLVPTTLIYIINHDIVHSPQA